MPTVVYIGSAEGVEAVAEALDRRMKVVHAPSDKDNLATVLAEADALIDAALTVRIDEQTLRFANKLQIVSCAATGTNHIDRAALARKGIALRTLREDTDVLDNLTSTAEHAWALLLASARGLLPAASDAANGHWRRELFPGVMLRSKQLGVIGCGRIGKWVAQYGMAFSMKVVGHDPYVQPWPAFIKRVSLEDLIETSDFITIHVSLSSETRPLVGAKLIARMKEGCVLVNTSRGEVIDERALLQALRRGRIRAAGLDVLAREPDIRMDPLVEYARSHPHLVITPHIAGFSPEAVRIACTRAALKVGDHLGF